MVAIQMKSALTVLCTYGLIVLLIIVIAVLVKLAVTAGGKALRRHEREALRQQFDKEDRDYEQRMRKAAQ